MQEADKTDQLERRITELRDNLDRKEQYMQSKEKKWHEVELALLPIYDQNPEIFDKMQELKINCDKVPRISNVVGMNERLAKRISREQKKLIKLRKLLTDPYIV